MSGTGDECRHNPLMHEEWSASLPPQYQVRTVLLFITPQVGICFWMESNISYRSILFCFCAYLDIIKITWWFATVAEKIPLVPALFWGICSHYWTETNRKICLKNSQSKKGDQTPHWGEGKRELKEEMHTLYHTCFEVNASRWWKQQFQ